jgi:CubicO group peptidase (beta-lactamase class C family)
MANESSLRQYDIPTGKLMYLTDHPTSCIFAVAVLAVVVPATVAQAASQEALTIREALSQFANDLLEFEPGTKMKYTSYGHIVLGCVIEGASGISYDRYMHQAIFEPARMPATRLDDVFAIIPHRAHGYRMTVSGELQTQSSSMSEKTSREWHQFQCQRHGKFRSCIVLAKLIPNHILDVMLTPAMTRDKKPTIYGLGFFRGGPIGAYHGLQEAGYGGDQQGFSSVMYLLPEKQFGIVILSNLEGQQSSLDFIGLSRKIYDAVSFQSIKSESNHASQ